MSDKLVSLDDLQAFADGLAPYLGNVYVDTSSNIYKTNETVIGQWIDGKPLYQKTFVITCQYDNEIISIETNVIPKVIEGGVLSTSEKDTIPFGYFVDSSEYVRVYSSGSSIVIQNKYYTTRPKAVITVKYTKSTDSVLPDGNYEGIINREIVTSLPQTGLTNCVYFLLTNQSSTTNKYEEWMYINGEWEHLGGDGTSKLPVIHTNVTAPITGSTTVTPG